MVTAREQVEKAATRPSHELCRLFSKFACIYICVFVCMYVRCGIDQLYTTIVNPFRPECYVVNDFASPARFCFVSLARRYLRIMVRAGARASFGRRSRGVHNRIPNTLLRITTVRIIETKPEPSPSNTKTSPKRIWNVRARVPGISTRSNAGTVHRMPNTCVNRSSTRPIVRDFVTRSYYGDARAFTFLTPKTAPDTVRRCW